jgi:hypothetical protein
MVQHYLLNAHLVSGVDAQLLINTHGVWVLEVTDVDVSIGIASRQHGVIRIKRWTRSHQERLLENGVDMFGDHIENNRVASVQTLQAPLRGRVGKFGAIS